jgi:hypothetical protein
MNEDELLITPVIARRGTKSYPSANHKTRQMKRFDKFTGSM